MRHRTDEASPDAEAGLPPLWVGRRRPLLAGLALTGLGQAAAGAVVAVATPRLLEAGAPVLTWSVGLLLAAAVVGVLRGVERVLAESLGQDYVLEVRRELVRAALGPERSANLGITVARTTNDLTAVRNWLALGIAPLVSGLPLMAGVVAVLVVLAPALAAVVTATLGMLGVGLWALSRPALHRARELRRRRGSMAARIADTVGAATSIRAAGGVERELKAVDGLSRKVAAAAVRRSVTSGAMRGGAAAAAMVGTVLVGAAGGLAALDVATVTTALLLVGLVSTPVADLGRVSEYRQAYNAARLVLTPVLDAAGREKKRERHRAGRAGRAVGGLSSGIVHIGGLSTRAGAVPELVAEPGARVAVRAGDSAAVDAVVDAVLGEDDAAWVQVDGHRLTGASARQRRRLVGYAAAGEPIENGTVARAVRYRCPDSDEAVAPVLFRVGLADRVAALPDGERTRLRRGGEPLDVDERARLQLARCLYGSPPLIVLDRLDEHLDRVGLETVRSTLADYPGVVLVVSDDPELVVGRHRVWQLDRSGAPLLVPRPAGRISTTTTTRPDARPSPES